MNVNRLIVGPGRKWTLVAGSALVLVLVVASVAAGASKRSAAGPQVAYLSFAVANSYDAPMLAAAKKVAKAA